MAADGHADTASGGTKTPVVRLKGFGPKTPPEPAPATAKSSEQVTKETAPPSSNPAPKPVTPPTPNYSVVRLKGFGPKTPPEPAPSPQAEVAQPSVSASTAVSASAVNVPPVEPLVKPSAEAQPRVEVPPAGGQPPAGEKQAAPSVGSNPVVRLKGFSSQRPAEAPAADPPVDRSPGDRSQDTPTWRNDAPTADFSRSTPPGNAAGFRPASEARFSSPDFASSSSPSASSASSAPNSSASARYEPDTNIDRMTKRRWWKDTLYNKSGRRAAEAQALNQGQPQV